MKKILSLLAIATLLTTTGCLISEGGGHGHRRGHRGHATIIAPAPVVIVPVVPVVRVRH